MNQLFIIIILNFIVALLNNSMLCYLSSHFVQSKWQGAKKKYLFFFLSSFITACFVSLLTYSDLSNGNPRFTTLSYALMNIIQIGCNYFLLQKYFSHITFSFSLFVQSINSALLFLFDYLLLTLLLPYIQTLSILNNYFATILLSGMCVLSGVVLIKISTNTKIFRSIRELMNEQRFMVIFGLLFYIVDVFLYYWTVSAEGLSYVNSFILSLLFLVFLTIFSLWSFATDKDKKLELSEGLVRQQQQYLSSLETIQVELRSLQHDYKNMLSGIYLHATEGKNKEIQEFLSTKFFSVDEKLEEEIKQQNQLLQIKLLEVKSLLLVKLQHAKQLGIMMQLEVIEPIETIAMEQSDFLRILGIFLDNAIEAASNEEHPEIKLLFIREANNLVVCISNTFTQQIEMKSIWQPKYSTKGKQRGLGLATVQKILASYQNVLKETYVKDNEFTQIITIVEE